MKIYVEFKDGRSKIFEHGYVGTNNGDDKSMPRILMYDKVSGIKELKGVVPYKNILYWEVLDEDNN